MSHHWKTAQPSDPDIDQLLAAEVPATAPRPRLIFTEPADRSPDLFEDEMAPESSAAAGQ